MVEHSLRHYGAGRSILLDRNGVAIAGNHTLEAAQEVGLPVRTIETDGSELIAVVRTDLDLTGEGREYTDARELAIIDNRSSEVGLEWDVERLIQHEADGIDISQAFFDDELEVLKQMQVQDFGADIGGGGPMGASDGTEGVDVDEHFWPVMTIPLPHEIMERWKAYLADQQQQYDLRPHEIFNALMDCADVPLW